MQTCQRSVSVTGCQHRYVNVTEERGAAFEPNTAAGSTQIHSEKKTKES